VIVRNSVASSVPSRMARSPSSPSAGRSSEWTSSKNARPVLGALSGDNPDASAVVLDHFTPSVLRSHSPDAYVARANRTRFFAIKRQRIGHLGRLIARGVPVLIYSAHRLREHVQ
jgi:hypothetical protein